MSMKKILASKKGRKASEPVFWDKFEKPEEEEEDDSTFTGLK